MYLKALEIQGFKSFPDKTVLTFGDDITAIVGPNGSGKSNISDAIRWVMGEQSTRALRGGKMEDVIFGGTQKRGPTGFAEVSLVLDNSGHLFDMEETEIMVTRRYYRSGESEYYINRRSCRLKDLNELFMDTGLGREGYSIIGQGKIDEILSIKSADRREIFEEAAGISRFRHRKEESERKLEHTEENLLRINDKIDELELQVGPLREQAAKAKQYLIFRDELRGLEISVWLDQLERLRMGSRKLLSDYEAAVRQRDEAGAALEALYARAEELAAQMREKDVEADSLRFQMAALDASVSEREAAVAVLKSQMENNAENLQRLTQELSQQEGRAGSIAAQIAQRKQGIAVSQERHQQVTRQIQEREWEAARAADRAGTLAAELEELRRREAMENASAGDAKALLSALAAAAQELLDRDEAARKELNATQERLEQVQTEQADVLRRLEEVREQRESLQNIIGGYRLRLQSRQKRLEALNDRVTQLRMEDSNLQSRIHLLTEMERAYEGYSKAVKLTMGEASRGGLKGIHGPVADLIRTPDQYAVALEIALGGALQHIVVDREEDGKAAIQWLKRRDGGRATFLPISSIRPNELREKGVDREAGFIGVANTLIQFAPQYAGIFANLLGRVVIVEDMDRAIAIARKFGHRFKIVTLDGQVLNPGGSMTGGSVSRSAGILSRANELERLNQQREQLTADWEQANREQSEAQREAGAAQYEMEVAQSQQRELEDSILKLEGEAGQYRVLLEGLSRSRDSLQADLKELADRSARTEADTAAARTRIQELEGTAAALRAEAEGKASGQSDLQSQAEAIRESLAGLRTEAAALEAEENASRRALEELESLCRDLTGDQAARQRMIDQCREKEAELQRKIAGEALALEELRDRRNAQEEAVRGIGAEKLELEGRRSRADKESRDKNQELLGMERECSVLEQKKNAAALEEKQILDKLWDTYELSHSAALEQRVELESVPKAQRRIGELKRSISGLGNVNVGAIEDFERVNERYTYLTDQRDDVSRSKAELEGIIREITEEMRDIFARQFQIINEAFAQTFVELFGGGQARLELEDERDILNCGIEIRVQPPGKALKVITLLSGGERAFVAIALYFAILKVRPTPFVVMDEIEAALDDSNVVRFARYMRGMADKTQFIVITHRRGTMEEADVLYGVTMQEQGISRMLTINLNDVEKELHIQE